MEKLFVLKKQKAALPWLSVLQVLVWTWAAAMNTLYDDDCNITITD